MPAKANITSVDVLDSFRAALIEYLSKARPTVGEVNSDVLRTRLWLENDQRVYWERQVKRLTRRLEDAKQALFGARLSNLRDAPMAEQLAVRKAQDAVDFADGKLKRVKYWLREFDHQAEPLVKQLEKLETVLASDLPKAIAYLSQASMTLDDYLRQGSSGAAPTIKEPDSEPVTVEKTT